MMRAMATPSGDGPRAGEMVAGRYRIERPLGEGGMAQVFQATDLAGGAAVALKILRREVAESPEAVRRLRQEGEVLSQLQHPAIVSVHTYGQLESGQLFLAMELLEGETLRERLRRETRLDPEPLAPVVAGIVAGLEAAHGAGVVHRDLKPDNVFLARLPGQTGFQVKILDFGISKVAGGDRLTRTGQVLGTPRYMAPEHFLRRQLGPQTDVFALASTFYEMLAGRRAIPGENIDAIQRNIVDVAGDFAPIADLQAGEHVTRFLRGAFVSDMNERYADARMMRDAFRKFVTAAGLGDTIKAEAASHSTVNFLVRRMQHKKDFPAISSTLTEINRLTGDNASASADTLANVILRDMSLTRKLLTMANSSFYGARASEVASVSQAVVLLGVQQVRMVASSLTLFGHLRGDSMTLRASMTRSCAMPSV